MAHNNKAKTGGAMKKQEAFWQQSWVTKVVSNGYNPAAKLLFMRIASFGEAGCWMINESLGEELGCSVSTVRRSISRLWSNGDLLITGWDGHGRKIYAAAHPKVKAELQKLYEQKKSRGKVKSKEQFREQIRLRMTNQMKMMTEVTKTYSRLQEIKEKRTRSNMT